MVRLMKRQPRSKRVAIGQFDSDAPTGETMSPRDNPLETRINIRTTTKIKDALTARAEEAGAESLSAFLLERGAAEPTQKEKREWAKRGPVAKAKREVAVAQQKLRDAQKETD